MVCNSRRSFFNIFATRRIYGRLAVSVALLQFQAEAFPIIGQIRSAHAAPGAHFKGRAPPPGGRDSVTSPWIAKSQTPTVEEPAHDSPPLVVILNGYPKRNDLLKQQAESLLSQVAGAGLNVGLVLTSHNASSFETSSGQMLTTEMIKPHHFCTPPAHLPSVKPHKYNCNKAESDNKYLGSIFLTNSTRHGFHWLLAGDDNTTFNVPKIKQVLEKYNHTKPHFFGLHLGKRGKSTIRPRGYENALKNCPPLGSPDKRRFWSFNVNEDITDVRQDCDPTPFRDDSWFGWGKGDHGIVLSSGMLDRIPPLVWQKCIDRIHTFGGDVRVAMCLGLQGYRIQPLSEAISRPKSSASEAPSTAATGSKPMDHNMGVTQFSIRSKPAQAQESAVAQLRMDELFNKTWPAPPGIAKTVRDSTNCSTWAGNGLRCEAEYPEHSLVRRWVPANATVMEFGARFGTTSCELARQLRNSGRLVVVEPDESVWPDLATNLEKHNCHARVLRGAVSSVPLHLVGRGYTGRTLRGAPAHGASSPRYSFDDVEHALDLKIDTLVIDCAGCAQDMMDQLGPKIRSQVKLILIEADMPSGARDCKEHCMNYTQFFEYLQDSGFEKVDSFNDCDRHRTNAPEGKWCGGWIDHYVYRRRVYKPVARSMAVLPPPSHWYRGGHA